MNATQAHGDGLPEPTLRRLSRAQFWGFFALLCAVFLFVEGPVWRHPWDIDRLDGSIGYSYLPIPILVALGLAARKALGWRAFFLDTLSLTLLKYAATFSLALVLWAVAEQPVGAAIAPAGSSPAAAAEVPPAPTPIAPGTTGTLDGTVVDGEGHPVEGALAFVAGGLEGFVFAAPAEAVTIENDGTGLLPRVVAAQVYQPIRARATDGRLHTLVASRDGAALFNIPLLGSGAWSAVTVRQAHGVAAVRCTVHPGVEAEGHLAVFAHPFFAITGADGRFHWQGVPAGPLKVAAWHAEDGEGGVDAALQKGATLSVRLPVARVR